MQPRQALETVQDLCFNGHSSWHCTAVQVGEHLGLREVSLRMRWDSMLLSRKSEAPHKIRHNLHVKSILMDVQREQKTGQLFLDKAHQDHQGAQSTTSTPASLNLAGLAPLGALA